MDLRERRLVTADRERDEIGQMPLRQRRQRGCRTASSTAQPVDVGLDQCKVRRGPQARCSPTTTRRSPATAGIVAGWHTQPLDLAQGSLHTKSCGLTCRQHDRRVRRQRDGLCALLDVQVCSESLMMKLSLSWPSRAIPSLVRVMR